MDDSLDLADTWQNVLSSLDGAALGPSGKASVQLSRLVNVYGELAVLAAPNTFIKDYLDSKGRPPIERSLSLLLGREVKLAVTVDATMGGDEDMADLLADATYAYAATSAGGDPADRPDRCLAVSAPSHGPSSPRD